MVHKAVLQNTNIFIFETTIFLVQRTIDRSIFGGLNADLLFAIASYARNVFIISSAEYIRAEDNTHVHVKFEFF